MGILSKPYIQTMLRDSALGIHNLLGMWRSTAGALRTLFQGKPSLPKSRKLIVTLAVLKTGTADHFYRSMNAYTRLPLIGSKNQLVLIEQVRWAILVEQQPPKRRSSSD